MLFVVLAMLVTLVVAGLVVAYVAYPHRGEEMPAAPWLGEALARAAEAAPVIEEEQGEHTPYLHRDHAEAGPQRRS